MVLESAVEGVTDLAGTSLSLLGKIGYVALWLQALGVILIIWLIVQAISFYYNWKRMKEVYQIKDDMRRVERKIDKILGKRR